MYCWRYDRMGRHSFRNIVGLYLETYLEIFSDVCKESWTWIQRSTDVFKALELVSNGHNNDAKWWQYDSVWGDDRFGTDLSHRSEEKLMLENTVNRRNNSRHNMLRLILDRIEFENLVEKKNV